MRFFEMNYLELLCCQAPTVEAWYYMDEISDQSTYNKDKISKDMVLTEPWVVAKSKRTNNWYYHNLDTDFISMKNICHTFH